MKNNAKGVFIFVFLTLAIFATLAVVKQPLTWQKKAKIEFLEANFEILPGKPLKRIWPNFCQGGEEKIPMLKPAAGEIRKLQPEFIRIDHLFDFSPIIQKDPQGNLTFDFSSLDQRVGEIVDLGATPFLSLSYFPESISPDPTKFPDSLSTWQLLVEKTIQRYSGKGEKSYPNIYYEVWNEPDLFGEMSANLYFKLYESSLKASEKCLDCQAFKIGGPAITTLKKAWLERFLDLVEEKKLKLDFLSWHSYQTNAQKTFKEVEEIKNLLGFRQLNPKPELIISEWGSVAEISPLHDSYFDASHTVDTVSWLEDSGLDKVFSFELKDGPSPKNEKYWGRWGLLTHQSFGLTPKPRFYSYLYLNKLLELRVTSQSLSPEIATIGSTDGKEAYIFLISRPREESSTNLLKFRLRKLLPGVYTVNLYSLNSQSQPLEAHPSQISVNDGELNLEIPAYPFSAILAELVRTSPSLIKAPGRTSQPEDFSARLTFFVPPLIFPLTSIKDVNSGKISFWFKPNWGIEETLTYFLLETKNEDGNGFNLWVEKKGPTQILHFSLLTANQIFLESRTPLAPWENSVWYWLNLNFDNQKLISSVNIGGQKIIFPLNPSRPVRLGDFLFVGADSASENSAEGSLDDLEIVINKQSLYQKDFN